LATTVVPVAAVVLPILPLAIRPAMPAAAAIEDVITGARIIEIIIPSISRIAVPVIIRRVVAIISARAVADGDAAITVAVVIAPTQCEGGGQREAGNGYF
jgi:hypothetical protein